MQLIVGNFAVIAIESRNARGPRRGLSLRERRTTVRTVLVCVRTPLAAQTVASAAARLGMAGVVRTAVTETEVMLRLAERPADVVLADTAADPAGQRRLRPPGPGPRAAGARCCFGAEESAGRRRPRQRRRPGRHPGVDHDLVSAVAKALLLLCPRSARRACRSTARTRSRPRWPAAPAALGRRPAARTGRPGWARRTGRPCRPCCRLGGPGAAWRRTRCDPATGAADGGPARREPQAGVADARRRPAAGRR